MSASTGFKRLGIAVAALASGGLIGLAIVSNPISTETAGNAVMAEVKSATGFEPTVRGPVSLSIFPAPQVTLADVALAGPDGDDAPLTAERLVAYIRWLPLLVGRYEVADLALERPRIAISIDGDGRTNWSPLVDRLARAIRAGADAGGQSLSFSEIRIADGTVVVEDGTRGLDETLEHVELSLAWPSITKSFAATGQLAWRNAPLDVALAIGDFSAALAGDTSGFKLRIAGKPVNLAFDGAMSYRPSVKIDGTLAADSDSLRSTMGWISGKQIPGGGLGRFALKASTSLVGGTIGLSNLNIELDGNVAEGVLSYAMSGRRMLQGTLAVDGLDLTPYASAVRLLAADAREWNQKPLALDWFDDIDFDLRVSAARVVSEQTELGRAAAAVTLRDGRFVVTVGKAQGFNGVINGSLAISKTDGGADMRSQVQFTDVDLDTSLADLFGIRRLEGKGNLSLAFDGQGDSVLALTRTLNGSAKLIATDGALTGFNVEQLLRRLERRPLAGSTDFRSGRTPFKTLDIALKITKGTARVEEVRFEGTKVRLALNGTASIPTRDLDLTGTAILLAASDTPPTFELPFFVQGSWDDPVMLPDTQALIRHSGAAAPLLDAVTDHRARNAVRSAVDRLLGQGALPAQAPRRDVQMPIPFEPSPQLDLLPGGEPPR